MRLRLLNVQSSIFFAALELLGGKHNWNLSFLGSSVDWSDRLNIKFIAFILRAQDSLPTPRRRVGLIFEEFRVLPENGDTHNNAPMHQSTK